MRQSVFGDACMSRLQIYEWYGWFKNSQISIEDDPNSGRPSTATTNEKKKEIESILQQNRRISIRKMSEEVKISIVASTFIPRILTVEQKQNRKQIAEELLQRAERNKNFLNKIIMGDETWVYEYNIDTKLRSS